MSASRHGLPERLGHGVLSALRAILPAGWKRRLKTLWDPNRVIDITHAVSTLDPFASRVAQTLEASGPLDPPQISVVTVSFEGRDYTKACIGSLLRSASVSSLEIVVVDNGSSDGSPELLHEIACRAPDRLRVFLNGENVGFAAAVNQGIRQAHGEVIVILNNDVIVPPTALETLIAHLEDPGVGLVVPCTNYSGNESRLDVDYDDVASLDAFTERLAEERRGHRFDIDVAAMYCLAMKRETHEQIGPLDERFEIGLFEDDDYSCRAREAGLRVVCAEDAFVHHFGQAAFMQLDAGAYEALWQKNRRRFEEKWGVEWVPYEKRRRGRTSSDTA